MTVGENKKETKPLPTKVREKVHLCTWLPEPLSHW